ncbi:MAG: FAD-dependent oxidoreductase [Eubacteriales bacterium]
MIKITQLKLKVTHTEQELTQLILNTLRIKKEELREWSIEKKSIDARKKPDIYYVYSVYAEVENESKILKHFSGSKHNNIMSTNCSKYEFPQTGTTVLNAPPVIVGSGPAGLFCAYELALAGYCPIVLERGGSVEERIEDVTHFWNTGLLNPESNVQFGEGGAGTFSDGKLNTGVKDPFGRNKHVLETFVAHGAPEEILYDSKPHIGTDILIDVVRNMRNHIIELGGEVRFHSKVTDLIIEDKKISGVLINDIDQINSEVVILAIGHSARDTFEALYKKQIAMEPKSFAIGVRVEHLQETINQSQYGEQYPSVLPASPYKLTATLPSKRGVYSFCMCPGGYVVNASSEQGLLAVNGMSYSDRSSKNANSAIVVTIQPEDYQKDEYISHPLAGMYYQQALERKAFQLANGLVPVQLFGDFCKNKPSTTYGSITPEIKGLFSLVNLRQILPDFLASSIEEGIQIFGKKIKYFSSPDVLLSGIESRTSSPIRILRNKVLESDVTGLYPCGEGAGYAGGITSAAIDGIKVFEALAVLYKPTK